MTLSTPRIHLDDIETLVFAGGGNRCWWQAGIISHLLGSGWKLPKTLIGTSAGAAIAASFLFNTTQKAFSSCQQLYAKNEQLFDWRSLAKFKLKFAHQEIYPNWIKSFTGDHNFEHIKTTSSELIVAVSRPSKVLGLTGSLAMGSIAYLIDKKMAHSVHPKLARLLGLRMEFFKLNKAGDAQSARILLQAAAAAAPFMSAQKIEGAWGFDGGYVDNAPIPLQTDIERKKTLVMLTRHYPHLPEIFRIQERIYWQPSKKIPVSTWDCRAQTNIEAAYALGEKDGSKFS